MDVLISSIGSRGDVQPIVSLALELRALGHTARLCVAPNFRKWVESFGLACIPIGPDLKQHVTRGTPGKLPKPSKDQLRQLAAHTIREQFRVVTAAARGCDLLVAAGPLQIAARSIAEALKISYAFVTYCPVTLPSPAHAPPKMGSHHSPSLPAIVNRLLWISNERRWDSLFLTTLNDERSQVGLAPIKRVQDFIFTHQPWLAADAVIAPASSTPRMQIVQTGAWFLADPAPLPAELESFLTNGAPPVYFGFGSMRGTEGTSAMFLEAARALGLRSIISRGWAGLSTPDTGTDVISIGDVDHEKLFTRVAAVVHHGGAGTTAAVARAGKPQVVVPHLYDQYYWAHRVKKLGVGVAAPTSDRLNVNALIAGLRGALRPETTARADALADRIELNGARIAAERLVREFGPPGGTFI